MAEIMLQQKPATYTAVNVKTHLSEVLSANCPGGEWIDQHFGKKLADLCAQPDSGASRLPREFRI